MTTPCLSEQDIARALDAGQHEAAAEFRARSVRHDAARDVVEVMTTRGAGFVIPRGWIAALADVPAADLQELAVWPDGSALELDAHDIHIAVHGLVMTILPRLMPDAALSVLLARRGGMAISAAKQAAARANGRKGGRPRKTPRTA